MISFRLFIQKDEEAIRNPIF